MIGFRHARRELRRRRVHQYANPPGLVRRRGKADAGAARTATGECRRAGSQRPTSRNGVSQEESA